MIESVRAWLDPLLLALQPEQLLPHLEAAGRIVLILVLAWCIRFIVRRIIRRVGRRIVDQTPDAESQRRAETLMRVLSYLLSLAVGVVTLLVVLGEFGVSVAPLLGAAGVVGIAVGFGAQTLVKDFFTGFFLLLENQIRTGDVVTIAGYSGAVEEVNLRFIRLRSYDGTVHFVPNSLITGVSNMTRGFSYAVMDLGVSYGTDVDQAIGVINAAATQMHQDPDWQSRVLGDIEIAGVDKLADSAVVIKCRFKTVALDQWAVRREFLKRIKQAFDEHGIEIPFPHMKIVQAATAKAAASDATEDPDREPLSRQD